MKRISFKTLKEIYGAKIAGTFVVALAGMMGVAPMTAFAQSKECICEIKCTEDSINEDCELCKYDYFYCEGAEPEEEPEEESVENPTYGPLTPDGNLTLVDDYGTLEAGGKQFITVVTKAGNYFYIIIDRDDQGDETVHFLNMVDEADLLSLMDEDEVNDYLAAKAPKEEPQIIVEEKEPEPEPEPVVEEPKKKSNSGIIVFVIIAAVGGGVGFMYFKKEKTKKPVNDNYDPDADYNEDEGDYLDSIPDDIEDDEDDFEIETSDEDDDEE